MLCVSDRNEEYVGSVLVVIFFLRGSLNLQSAYDIMIPNCSDKYLINMKKHINQVLFSILLVRVQGSWG